MPRSLPLRPSDWGRDCYGELRRIPLFFPRTRVNREHQGSATGFGEYLHDDERLVAHAGLLPLLLSAIPNDESLEALRHIRRRPAPDPFSFSPVHYRKEALRLDPDVRGYVASGVAHLVGAGGSGGFLTEVHVEVLVDLHAPLFGVAVDLEQVGALFGHLGVELVVPAAIERVGHIEPLAVQRELEHLRAAIQFAPRGLLALAEQAAAPDSAGEARV